LQRLHEDYPKMEILLVNSGESASVARPYYQHSMVTVTIALDEDGQVNNLYHVYAIPTLIFVDDQGVIRQVNVGASSPQTLQEGLAAIGVR